MKGIWATLAIVCGTSPAFAFDPPLAGQVQVTRTEEAALDSTWIPTGRWTRDGLPKDEVEGEIRRTAWQTTPPEGFTTLSILQPIREALAGDGWTLGLDCETDECGGYDFRYALDLFPEPEMHVDLGDYRFLEAHRAEQRVAVVISRTAKLGFVQLTEVSPAGKTPKGTPQVVTGETPPTQAEFGQGATVLEGVEFAQGGTSLTGEQPELQPLLQWLTAHPDRRIILVGHTDDSGALDININLSRARAGAVRDWLVAGGIDTARIETEGVGFLAPRDTNANEAGRARNRRVEVLVR
ncbi:OmpA family protein [Falsirhodobacter sp. alg1]|uniref:OmpA family protein n=1 Tax=Falsirhodobacter sp. alg1 TaxID=1472418 RepID=UPI0006945B00|nr:OmpA family protein [Falsirhodobacter sp. alg1]